MVKGGDARVRAVRDDERRFALEVGQAQYTVMCQEDGGATMTASLPPGSGTCSSSTRQPRRTGVDQQVREPVRRRAHGPIGRDGAARAQGPAAGDPESRLDVDLPSIGFYRLSNRWTATVRSSVAPATRARTAELYVPNDAASAVAEAPRGRRGRRSVRGSRRDSLRSRWPILYGNDLDDNRLSRPGSVGWSSSARGLPRPGGAPAAQGGGRARAAVGFRSRARIPHHGYEVRFQSEPAGG